MGAHTHVETVLTACLDHVLVGGDAGGLESLGAQLLEFVGDHVHAGREVIDTGALPAQVEDADLRIRDTAVEPALGVGLVLAWLSRQQRRRSQARDTHSSGSNGRVYVPL